jgi:hypothetical protein
VKDQPSNLVVWFGVLGGPVAWAAQFVGGYAFGIAQCDQPRTRWRLPVHWWDAGLAAGALVIAVLAFAVSLRLFLRTRDPDHEVFDRTARGDTTAEPIGRVQFLATLGLTVNPLAAAIIVMSGIGAPLLSLCHQS